MSVWDRLRGSRTAEWLRAQLAAGEIAHAWLLIGASGSGKRAAAQTMAAALNCTVQKGRGCGECSSCLRVLRRRHPDVHHIVPEGPIIPVDVIRESVIPEAARSPFESTYKVFIIEEADRMNDPAQNALLKTLEEPHSDTVFILISDNEEELLETVASRCRIVRLDPVPEEAVVEALTAEGAPESITLLAARISDGDLERARAVAFEDGVVERRRLWPRIPARLSSPVDALDAAAEILAESKEAVRGREKSQREELAELAETMGEGRGTAGVRTALAKRHRRELKRLEEDVLAEALQTLGSFYRDVLVCKAGAHDAVANIDLLEELESWAGSDEITPADLTAAVDRCVQATASFASNANPTLAIESGLLDVYELVPSPARVGSTW
jgi:DNA polymerase III subunit delta'